MADTLAITCPHCKSRLGLTPQHVGKKIVCPQCNETVSASFEPLMVGSAKSPVARSDKLYSVGRNAKSSASLMSALGVLSILGGFVMGLVASEGDFGGLGTGVAVMWITAGALEGFLFLAIASGLSGISAICEHLDRHS